MNKEDFPIPFDSVASEILGPEYELSFVLTDKKLSRELNNKYREKNKPTNVLSFPLSETSGEIFIDLETAREEAPSFGKNFEEMLLSLFIHGLLHLKGMQHGRKMDETEQELFKKWRAKSQPV